MEWGQGLLRLATALVRENAALERENATLRDRIAELERSAALDSTTSSKPPASDGLRKKSRTQRRTRSQRGKSGRPSGGQPGHKGTTLARTESPDHVVDHDPSACSGCGAPLSDADPHRAPVCRQVFDVPEPRPLEVTEHRAHRCLCGACATVTGAVFPDGVTAPVQYGPRITAWVSYLLYAQFVPEKRLAELMSDLFAVSISTATITAMGRRTARRFEPFLAHVADVIRTAVPVKHLDETGLRIAARTRWLHVLCTPFLTVLRIGAGRGDVEKDLEGILIHDDYAAYFTLKGVRHGACNAHHLRKLQALIDIEKEDWAKSMHRLPERAHRATRFSRENGRDVPASLGARILDHAIAFHEAQPPLRTGKRGRKKRRIGHNLALRLRKHKEGCLRSLTDPRTPFFLGDAFGRVLRRRCRIHRLEVCLGLRQGLGKRRGVALIGRVQLGRHHRAGVQIHRVLGLVGQMRRAVLHLGDLGLGVALRNPIRVGKLLALALPLQTRQVLGRGCLDPAFPG